MTLSDKGFYEIEKYKKGSIVSPTAYYEKDVKQSIKQLKLLRKDMHQYLMNKEVPLKIRIRVMTMMEMGISDIFGDKLVEASE